MATLIVYGVPAVIDQNVLAGVILDLEMAAGPDLANGDKAPKKVSVFFTNDLIQQGLGKELICFINILSPASSGTRRKIANNVLHVLGFVGDKLFRQGYALTSRYSTLKPGTKPVGATPQKHQWRYLDADKFQWRKMIRV